MGWENTTCRRIKSKERINNISNNKDKLIGHCLSSVEEFNSENWIEGIVRERWIRRQQLIASIKVYNKYEKPITWLKIESTGIIDIEKTS